MRVLISDSMSEKGIELLKGNSKLQVDVRTDLSPENLLGCIGEYEVLLVRSKTKVNKDVIEAGKKLKLIGRAGTGVDNVDLPYASKKGIVVMNTPGGNTVSAAEHTISMMLSLSRNIPQAYMSMKNRIWEKKKYMGTEVKDKVLGIIGLGRIGSEVAKRAIGLSMKVIGFDPIINKDRAKEMGIELTSLDKIFRESDYITIHVPKTKETENMINESTLEKMKKTVRIINCARGGIINEKDLAEAVKTGRIAGAALDVFDKEPSFDSPVMEVENIIVTPHLGASTEEAQEQVAVDLAKQVIDYCEKGIINNAVNMPSIDQEQMKILEPYIDLAEKLGLIASQMNDGSVNKIKVRYSGDILKYNVTPLTLSVLKGFLEPVLDEKGSLNLINVSLIAEERGIKVEESKTSNLKNYTNLIELEIRTHKSVNHVSGTLFGNKVARLVYLGDSQIDVIPGKYLLLCYNHDKTGVIGKIGTILGENEINIASMHTGRSEKGGTAITVINIDSYVPEEIIKKLRGIKEIIDIKMLRL